MVDRDVLLRKTRLNCDFTVSFEGRTARCSGFFVRWTRCPRCLTYGIRALFDFPSLCDCGRNGTRAISNRVGPLSPVEYRQQQDFRGQKYGSFSFISYRFILFGSAEKVLEERLLNVLKDNCSSIHQNLAAVVIYSSYFDFC